MKKQDTPDKRPTASDVARRAGVSRTQVSYVLNNNRMDHVSQDNRQKILDAAKELGYQPHSSAQTLRRGYSKEFSIFFPAPYPPRLNRMIGSIHETGLERGFLPVQYSFHSYRDRDRLKQSLDAMLARKPYGVFCSLMDLCEKDIDYMLERGVRKILVWDVEQHSKYTTLYLPVYEIGAMAADHLISKGYDRIGFIKPSDPVQTRSFKLRHEGFSERFKRGNGTVTIMEWDQEVFRPTMESARTFLERYIGEKDFPRAIYAFSDDYALPLIAALRERGVAVPGQVAVLGTDNINYSEMMTPKLTTIQMDTQHLGLRAVALMNHLISGEPVEEQFRKNPVPLLIEREST